MWLGNDMPDDPAGGHECVPGPDDGDIAAAAAGGPGDPDGAQADAAAYEPLPFDTITAVDLDEDGVLETMIVHDGDEITVSYDLDGDGRTDYETVFDGEGHAVSWQDQLDPDGSRHWRRVQG